MVRLNLQNLSQVVKGKKIGLALGGGGARGVAHIGVIKALNTAKIPIHAIAGTSMGAIIGAWYAIHGEINSIEDIFLDIKEKDMVSSLKLYWRRDGILFRDPKVAKAVEKGIEDKKFKDCMVPFEVVATDIKNGDEVILKEGDISEAVRASSAVPFIFKPVSINNRLLIDGGLVDPVPVEAVRKMGADFVIAVDVTRGWLDITESPARLIDIPKVIDKVMTAIEYQIARKQLEGADMVLKPEVMSFDWLDFPHSKEMIIAGAEEVRRNLSEIYRRTGYAAAPKSIFTRFMDFVLRG